MPWPSSNDIRALEKKADGVFIFAFTLVQFVTDGSAPPDQKLQSVLKLHAGLDPLYAQVLKAVPNIACFRMVLTTLMIVHVQPSINLLAELLRLPTGNVTHALTSIQSIIHIPADNTTPIQLNHTSLRDFLVDRERSQELFIDPPAAHFTLGTNCLTLMNSTFQRDMFPENAGSYYATEHWVRHLKDGGVTTKEPLKLVLVQLGNFVTSEVIEVWINLLIFSRMTSEACTDLVALVETYKHLEKGGLSDIVTKIKSRVKTDNKDAAHIITRSNDYMDRNEYDAISANMIMIAEMALRDFLPPRPSPH